VERARGDGRSGRGTFFDAHGQTHQCRFSHRGLDPARQHHDTGAGPGDDAICAAPGRIGTARDCAAALTASDASGIACAGGRQKAGRVETIARARAGAGADRADRTGSGSASSRSGERLILSKAFAGR
jgi:hypothetical protein